MKVKIEGMEGLDKLASKTEQYEKELDRLNGQSYDTSQTGFVPTPILHQDSKQMSEEESALFEQNNPDLFRFIKSLEHRLTSIFRG